MALLTATDVQTWVPGASDNPELIAPVIQQAQALAQNYCGRVLESASFDEYYDVPRRTTAIALRHYPVTTVTAVYENAQDDSPDELDDDDYYLDADAGVLHRDGGYWSAGRQAVRVQYTAGYTSATLPADLKNALLDLVAWLLHQRANVGVRRESVDGYTVDYESGLPSRVVAVLERYRSRVVG